MVTHPSHYEDSGHVVVLTFNRVFITHIEIKEKSGEVFDEKLRQIHEKLSH